MPISPPLLKRLADRALDVDRNGDWPVDQFGWVADDGVLGWVIPEDVQGSEVSRGELIQGYLALSQACLTTAFILTQRNGACQRIVCSDNQELKQRLLPDLASGRLFATVGVSHLTTSRQHLATPAVQAVVSDDQIELNGTIPWVTGAAHADLLVTGGTCEDGRQVLVVLPTSTPGVTVQPTAELMALTASHTASVNVQNSVIPRDHLLAGPVEGVMKQGQGGGAGSLVTSTLAVGLASRAADMIADQASRRTDLAATSAQFSEELADLRKTLLDAAESDASGIPYDAAVIRQRANSFVLRITQAAMAVSKGAGFVKGHPAELAVREAMFFLVWSCPQPVVQGVLEELTCREGLA